MIAQELVVFGDGRLTCGESTMRAALGINDITPDKIEGDNATPAGSFALREVLYRSDKVQRPETQLSTREILPSDGWCTATEDSQYNKLVSLPYPARSEQLWRDDRIYDIVVVLGYNDDPVVPGKGSAIFLHLARENYTPTEGCVAISLKDMEVLLKSVGPGTVLTIRQV